MLTYNSRFYDTFGKTYLFDLDHWYLKRELTKQEQENWQSKYSMDAYHVGNVSPLQFVICL